MRQRSALMCGVGLLAVLVLAGVASADVVWTAYNDAVWYTGQLATNITKAGPSYTSYTPNSAVLVKYADNTSTGVTATFTVTNSDGGKISTHTGTMSGDALAIFNGKVDTSGGWVNGCWHSYWGATGGSVILTFTGLNPAYTYTFVSFGGSFSIYDTVGSFATLSDVTSATNNSSSGMTKDGLKTTLSDGMNTSLVTRYDDIVPGPDGDFTVTFRAGKECNDGGQLLNAFMLQMLPEPATLALLAIGGLGLLARRRRK